MPMARGSARSARCMTMAPAQAWRSRARMRRRCWCRSRAPACRRSMWRGRVLVVPPEEIEPPASGRPHRPRKTAMAGPARPDGRDDLARIRADAVPGDVPRAAGAFACRPRAAVGLWSLQTVNIRDFATDRHRTVDDTPFGGGAGMVLRPDVVDAAIASVADDRPLVFLTPRGRPLTQRDVRRYAAGPGIILLCGRYEGVDQRVIEARGMEEVSIGDYVLSGGELPALVLLDAAVRLLPGVMGAADSAAEEVVLAAPAGIPALHPARRMAGTARARRAAVRPPRRDRRLAPGRGGTRSPASAAPTCGTRTHQPLARRRLPVRRPRRKESRRKDPSDEHHPALRGRADRPPDREPRRARLRAGRHGARRGEGGGRRAHPHPGVRGRVHRAAPTRG